MSPVGHLLYLFTQQNELLMNVLLNIGPESDEGSSNNNRVCPEGRKKCSFSIMWPKSDRTVGVCPQRVEGCSSERYSISVRVCV